MTECLIFETMEKAIEYAEKNKDACGWAGYSVRRSGDGWVLEVEKKMDNAMALKVLKNERACVIRNIDGCDRDCARCDLVLPDHEILAGYDIAIKAIEKKAKEREVMNSAEVIQALNACAASNCDICPLRRDDRCISSLAKDALKLIELMAVRTSADSEERPLIGAKHD